MYITPEVYGIPLFSGSKPASILPFP
jgi:hypothetical protein